MKFKIVLLSAVFLIGSSVFGQKTGEEIFKENLCNACHMLTDMRLVGPGLAGILDRRDRAWVKKWITNSQDLIASGDEQAIAVFEEYNKVPMLAYDLPDEDMEALIDYIAGIEAETAVEELVEAEVVEKDEVMPEKVEEIVDVKEKSALSKAFDGRPFLSTFFWSTLILLLLGIVAVLGAKVKKTDV